MGYFFFFCFVSSFCFLNSFVHFFFFLVITLCTRRPIFSVVSDGCVAGNSIIGYTGHRDVYELSSYSTLMGRRGGGGVDGVQKLQRYHDVDRH